MSKKTITVDAAEYQRLQLVEAFMPHVIGRGLFPGVVHDLAQRAAESGRFALNSDGSLNATSYDVTDFISDIEGSASHLFQDFRSEQQSSDEKRESEQARIDAMSPMQKLAYANRLAAKKSS